MKNGDNLKKLAVNVDRLEVDWNAQRVQINDRISRGGKPVLNLSWVLGALSVAAMIVAAVVIFTFSAPHVEDGSDLFTDIDIEEYDMPYGLYVLNGFTEEASSFDETANFILAEEGDTL